MAKNFKDLRIRMVALHKDGLGYKKIGNTLKLSYSTGQGHTEVFQDGFQSEQALQGTIKDVESSCCASGAEAGYKNRRMSAASIALEVAEAEVNWSWKQKLGRTAW